MHMDRGIPTWEVFGLGKDIFGNIIPNVTDTETK